MKVKIVSDGTAINTTIHDEEGNDLSNILAVKSIYLSVGEDAKVQLELCDAEFRINTEADIIISEAMKEQLRRMGWVKNDA